MDFEKWEKKYEKGFKPIEYYDRYGKPQTEEKPDFKKISQDLHKKRELNKKDLFEICKWKASRRKELVKDGLNDSKISIVNISEIVLSPDKSLYDKFSELTKIRGIRIPRASAIMTVLYPKTYCVVDFWAWHGLLTILRKKLNDNTDFLKALDHYRKYGSSIDSYSYYLKQIKKIADDVGNKAPRQIEMALFSFAKVTTEQNRKNQKIVKKL